MAQLIPNFIDMNNPRLDGERLVHSWLSQDNVPGIVFYSLLQKNHKHKMIGEVDFLYICKKGILCIEVKGGQSIYRKDRQWYSLNKAGKEVEIHNPFKQSMDCMYALRNYLIDIYGWNSEQAKYLIGYSVVFPECKFTGSGNDLVTEVMFDCSRGLDDFSKFLEQTLEYWNEQEFIHHGIRKNGLTDIQIKQLADLLRGDFCVVPSMNLEIQHVHQRMLQLTEEQYDALDVTLENKRVIIQGVAGTGKSLLAIEKARKLIAMNKKVLFICYNRNMAQYVRQAFNDCSKNGSFIGTYHSFVQNTLNKHELFNCDVAILGNILLKNCSEIEEYDCIIVDEAQDLMHASVWESLSKILKGGMEKGEWVLFLDPNQNIFNNSEEYDFAWEYLRESYSPVLISLSQNCRNTVQIGKNTSVLTLVPPAKHMKISGPKVISKSYDSNTDLIKMLRKDLTSLFAGGTSPGDIVILSKYKLENSGISSQKAMCNMEIKEISDISRFQNRTLNFFTVQSFKGLESKIVFFIDVDGFKSVKERMLNYVAMSRAKIMLYVYYKEEKKMEYMEAMCEGQELL